MIAKLAGLLDSVGEDWAVIDVNGVGYLVFCSGRTLGQMPGTGEAVRLYIDTHVREDHIHLYGFAEDAEREWFRLLLSVQGVGAKVGLAILGTLRPDELTQAIAAQDKTVVTRAQGVGPKLATRIVNELKDKVGGMALGTVAAGGVAAAMPAATPLPAEATSEAVSALVNLGYGRSDAFSAVATAARQTGEGATVEVLIRDALALLGQGN